MRERIQLQLIDTASRYLLPAAIAHAPIVGVVAVLALRAGESRSVLAWVVCEVAMHVAAVVLYVQHRRVPAASLGARRVAQTVALHRALCAAVGLCFGWAGAMWTQSHDATLALATIIALAGVGAGATMATGPDPIACRLMLLGVFVPPCATSAPSRPSEAVLWIGYALGCLMTNAYVHRVIREKLMLRAEKDALLAEAVLQRRATEVARDEAQRTTATLQRFLAAASHDLRQPAQALALFVDLLESAEDTEQASTLRAALRRSVEVLCSTLDALFEISTLDADKLTVRPTLVHVRDIAEQVWAGTRELCLAHDVTLTIAGSGSYVLADQALLLRVLHNLTSNAIKHSGSDRVLVAFRRRGLFAVAQIWDRGVGVALTDQTRIFDEFVQVGNRERKRERGLGLGLSIVRRICERCGWGLSLESIPGRGTRVSVSVPMAAPPEATDEPSEMARVDARAVLLVEDDPSVRDAMCSWLTAAGLAVMTASTTDEALALLHAHPELELLVSDLRLPGATPLELLFDAARARSPTPLEIIAVTGDVAPPAWFRRDATLLLQKPVSGRALFESLAHSRARASSESGREGPTSTP